MNDRDELAARIARLEKWANDFSTSAEHADAPIFVTKAWEDEERERSARIRARAALTKAQGNVMVKPPEFPPGFSKPHPSSGGRVA